MKPKWIVADVETTGTDPEIDRVVEVAYLELDEDGIVIENSKFDSLIDPGRSIPCAAAAINGVRDNIIEEQQPPKIEEVPFPTGEVILIAHNAEFDYEFLKPHMNIVDTMCTLMLSRRLLPGVDNYKLGTLSCYCDLPQQLSHRAACDVLDCAALVGYLCDGSELSLEEMLAYSKKNVVLKWCQIGKKHFGDLWSDVPRGYLQWILREGTFDRDTEYTAKYWLER